MPRFNGVPVEEKKPRFGGVAVEPSPNGPSKEAMSFDPGVEGYNPETGMVERSKGASFAHGASDTASFGFADELASYLGNWLTGVPRDQVLTEMRGLQDQAQKDNPKSYLAGQVAGGVAQGVAAGPATFTARTAGMALGPRMLAGAADGLLLGGAYGAGSGTDANSRIKESLLSGGMGAVAGGAFPLVAAGLGKGYEALMNSIRGNRVAQGTGTSPEALRVLGNVLDGDGTLGPQGQANMARAGQEAMLADAGPTARTALDTAVQRSGPGAVVAREAIDSRVGRDTQALTQVLDDTMGKPGESLSRELVVYGDRTNPTSLLYKKAYNTPIDYSLPQAREIEELVKGRVPPAAIKAANDLMRVEGEQSRQIMAKIADDGSVVFEKLPDVRQLDYITRGLNQVAQSAEGQGALGGTTPIGRAYGNLARDIRSRLKEIVPEYKAAVDRAGTEIGKVKATEFGSTLLNPSVTRDQVKEFVTDISQAEKQKLVQGVRQQIDDVMARVSRTVQDGNVDAREAVKALKDLSSRANREKLTLAVGETQAKSLFSELDRVATSFDLRASVADNSKTYARGAMDQRIKDVTAPGAVGTAARGEPIKAVKRIIQTLTGQTDEVLKGKEDRLYGEIARLLTMRGGPGQNVFDAVQGMRQTDAATSLMRDRIVRSLSGPHLAYPVGNQSRERFLPR